MGKTQFESSGKIARMNDEPVWRLNDGRVFVRMVKIDVALKTKGGIHLLQSSAESAALGKGIYDGQGRLIEIDKSCIYGRVVACAKRANRSTCIAESDEKQGDFPLPPGTFVVISGAVAAYKIDPFDEIYAFNTSEIQHWYLPSDPKPKWAPEE